MSICCHYYYYYYYAAFNAPCVGHKADESLHNVLEATGKMRMWMCGCCNGVPIEVGHIDNFMT